MNKKLFLYKSIPFRVLLLFNIKNIFHELVFLILNTLLIFSSLVFGIISRFFDTQVSLLVAFNFYILFFISCLLFILILRMVQFFFHNKIEDKTTFITLSNQVSRTKLFLSTWFLMVIVCIFNFLLSFIFINFLNFSLNKFKLNELLLNITLVFLIYGSICSILLVNFIIFLIFVFSLQTTTVICTLLLSLNFLANLPTSFQTANEKDMTIYIEKNSTPIAIKLTDIQDAFSLQKYVNEGKIKYSHLSKWINDKFLEAEYYENNFTTNEQNNRIRLENVWQPLGIIKSNPDLIERKNLKLYTVPSTDSAIDTSIWKAGDTIDIDLQLDYSFVNIDELNRMANEESDLEIKLILEDLFNFANYIKKQFASDLQIEKYNLFSDFIFVNSNSKIINKSKNNVTIPIKKDYLKTIFEFYLKGNYSSGYLTLDPTTARQFVTNDLNFELLFITRILENYFIKYTSHYLNTVNYKLLLNSGDWTKYEESRKKLNLFSYFNVFNGLWTNYTFNSGFSYEDFWFLPSSESKINFAEQKNLFLGYSDFTLKRNEYDKIDQYSYNNYIKPYYYLIALLIFSLITFIFVIYKFQKIDLK
ncbi:ABC transporter permease [Spiroplasma taiwanense]|uniref:ABC transporter permease n=1 Tax=Spiroplasma taiwanense CT-1 TaxID=1276220 RepID=S5LTN2_9MOLU|nr:ABC transporter permease [Spiroplasma taiwanense]AGR41069.1 ABC transporter permease [Spiroplasma taiwanense CT-1]